MFMKKTSSLYVLWQIKVRKKNEQITTTERDRVGLLREFRKSRNFSLMNAVLVLKIIKTHSKRITKQNFRSKKREGKKPGSSLKRRAFRCNC